MLDGEGFLLVYSITERDSFKVIESYHQQILRVKDTQAVPIIVVGNKSDLERERRVDMVGASHLNFHSTPSLRIGLLTGDTWGPAVGIVQT
jgi:GTPase KRas